MSRILPIRSISVFTLAMMNVAAVSSLRNWPLAAEYGFSSVFFFLIAGLLFFIPVSLVSAELATGWPQKGGVFVWVKEAFGHRAGFLSIWLLWFENVFYYPLLLSFIAATIAYLFKPELASSGVYTSCVILILFWVATLFNLRNMKTSSWISTIGALCGTFIPGLLIIVLGFTWFFSGKPMEISFTWSSLTPSFDNPQQFAFLTGIMLSLAGMELNAVHASDVKEPQKNYPRAILLSAILIIVMYVFGVLSIAIVIPSKEISLVAGSLQAFSHLLNAYNLGGLLKIMVALIAIGAVGTLSTWIIGPSKGLLAAAQAGDLPPFFHKSTKSGMPIALLTTQGIIVSLLSLLFVFMPTINSAFWLLTVVAAQLYLIMYVLLFLAGIRLRYKNPEVHRTYRLPGKNNIGMWIAGGAGIIGSLLCFFVGFLPPNQAAVEKPYVYAFTLICCILVSCCIPSLILRFKKKSWLKDEN